MHLEDKHRHKEMAAAPTSAWDYIDELSTRPEEESDAEEGPKKRFSNMDALAYYMQAVQLREEQHIPVIGPSLDRRMLRLMANVLNSNSVKGLICFACATVHTYVRSW